ncbi:MAG TPA: carboxyl transferase domain-containing protein [Rhodoblastus sp.]|nr:carboxyl transferase domain-containing protein [Rhodoblastus sp.]
MDTKADLPSEKPLRNDLRRVIDAKLAALDKARPEAVGKRRKTGHWTARENIDYFLDADSFLEYGQLARPAKPGMSGPADGFIMGTGTVDGKRVAVAAYDYTVYAGTQSFINHAKIDRFLRLVKELRLPFVIWAEGGGWRPHETNMAHRDHVETFVLLAQLSGLTPTVAIVAGRCFAGNANIVGLCDVAIATRKIAMGMAGPALVEAALGQKLTPEELGPAEVHQRSGAIDILVDDEKTAADAARKYLGYFHGPGEAGPEPDTLALRDVVPESMRRAYDVRKVIAGIADEDSILELRPKYAAGAVTALIKVGGRPIGVIANQPMARAGAMDTPVCDKMSRFIQLCDAHDIPMLTLCDTPGLMVGPDAEATALVKHSARVLTALANATVPFMAVVLRKAYGLGYQILAAMPLNPAVLVAWPTAEFGMMGTEGATKILHRNELNELPDAAARAELEARLSRESRERNDALEVAARYEFDDVIDPAETRDVVLKFLKSLPPTPPRSGRKRWIDNW